MHITAWGKKGLEKVHESFVFLIFMGYCWHEQNPARPIMKNVSGCTCCTGSNENWLLSTLIWNTTLVFATRHWTQHGSSGAARQKKICSVILERDQSEGRQTNMAGQTQMYGQGPFQTGGQTVWNKQVVWTSVRLASNVPLEFWNMWRILGWCNLLNVGVLVGLPAAMGPIMMRNKYSLTQCGF